jgi:ABC-type glycerol-3-phosphate transport system permease component
MTTTSSARRTMRAIPHVRSHDTGYQTLLVFIMTVLCFITVAPFVWIVLTSVKPNTEIYTTSLQILPQVPTLEHFHRVIERGNQLPTYVINTLYYSATTIFAVTVLSALAGYALGMLSFRGSGVFVNFVLLILSIPWIILIVPILIFEFRLQIWNTRLGLVLPYIGLFLPVAIWIMRGSFVGMPRELGESARIDGASEMQVFAHIYLPMARGGVASVILLTFIDIWNEVLLAASLVINPQLANINTGLRTLAEEGAAILIAMIPTLIVFVVLQRYYVRGISEGALAGF